MVTKSTHALNQVSGATVIGKEIGGGGVAEGAQAATPLLPFYCQNALEVLSEGQKFQIFLGEHAPQTLLDG